MAAATLTITLEDNGTVNLQGPLTNPVLCYGLMEAAKDSLRMFLAEQRGEKRIIAPPPGMVVPT